MSPAETLSEVLKENVVLRSVLREQRKLQAALRTMNVRLRSFLATVPGVLYSFHPDGTSEYMSPSVEGLLGKPGTWYMEDPSRYLDQVSRDDLGRVYRWRLQLLLAKVPCESELRYRVVRPDGTTVEVLDRANVVFEGGRLVRVDGVIVAVQPEAEAAELAQAR